MRQPMMKLFLMVFASILAISITARVQAGPGCDVGTFQGAYGYSGGGVLIQGQTVLRIDVVGRLVADGAGGVTGADTFSANGQILRRTFTGNYTVREDCTGTFANTDDRGLTFRFDHVIVAEGNQINLVASDPGFVGTVVMKSQGIAEDCTAAALAGGYGSRANGTIFQEGAAIPVAASGRLTADGQGGLAGADTVSVGGQVLRRSYTGAAKINPDCTGAATVADNLGQGANFDFVIVRGGRELFAIQSDSGTNFLAQFKQQ